MTIAEHKSALRKEARQAGQKLKKEQAALQDEAIRRRVLALPEYTAAATLFVYVSIAGEIDTHHIIAHALEQGKTVAVPRCIAPGVMELRRIESINQLQTASFGLLEPGEDCPLLAPAKVDFAVVPCAACDNACNRLGKGGGYYDRTLHQRHFPVAALCREATLYPKLPTEAWDQPVDMVVTEQRILRRV